MPFCAKCGNQVGETAAFCTKCGTRRGADAAAPMAIIANAGRSVTTAVRGSVAIPAPRAVLMVHQKSTGLAVILSFFWSGLGQIYTGQIAKGVLMMVLYPALIWVGFGTVIAGALATAGNVSPNSSSAGTGLALFGLLCLIASFALWIYGMVSAYQTVERINQKQLASL